jgi:hypothetical protein
MARGFLMRIGSMLAGGLLALLACDCGIGVPDLRLTLRLTSPMPHTAEDTQKLLWFDARVIQRRLDWLCDEPGFRQPGERANVESNDSQVVVSISGMSGAGRIEYLSSCRGRVSVRLVAPESTAVAKLDSAVAWLRVHGHSSAGLESLVATALDRTSYFAVSQRVYSDVKCALALVDTAAFGQWRPAFGPLDSGKKDTSRTLYFVEEHPEMTNDRGHLILSAFAQRFHGVPSSPTSPVIRNQDQPFEVEVYFSDDTVVGCNPARKFSEITRLHDGERLALMLDSVVLDAPRFYGSHDDALFSVGTNDTGRVPLRAT